ncbi:MAG: MBOAT family O-acyltransferase [Vicinamibacterales bacterium]
MSFNTFTFVVFAAVFYSVFPFVARRRQLLYAFVVVSSFVFYGWWDARYLALLVLTGLIDYAAALCMVRWPAARRGIFIASVTSNLSILVLFKYSRFVADNIDALSRTVGISLSVSSHLPALFAVLPVGISFYTFHSLSYTIDVYRGRLMPTPNPLKFFAFLSLFPPLVAGPILRAAEFLPQLDRRPEVTSQQVRDGTILVVMGYFKKTVLADNLAPFVDAAFGAPLIHTSPVYWWLIASLFAVQIFCDFSGYSDIARGLSKWMGYELTLNFDRPYESTSLRDFWTRWHISLSTWFRDYIYLPLGGSKRGAGTAHRNLWFTMLLSGFWHGAGWTYLAWGAYHAALISIERLTAWPEKLARSVAGRIATRVLVLALVWVGWILFRAQSISQAGQIIATMFSWRPLTWDFFPDRIGLVPLIVLATTAVWVLVGRGAMRWAETATPRVVLWLEPPLVAVLALCCVYLRGPGKQFIYFQF